MYSGKKSTSFPFLIANQAEGLEPKTIKRIHHLKCENLRLNDKHILYFLLQNLVLEKVLAEYEIAPEVPITRSATALAFYLAAKPTGPRAVRVVVGVVVEGSGLPV